jgi:hypothetical protein
MRVSYVTRSEVTFFFLLGHQFTDKVYGAQSKTSFKNFAKNHHQTGLLCVQC